MNLLSYNADECPTCGSNRVDFPLNNWEGRRDTPSGGTMDCDCAGQNLLWKKFIRSNINKNFWFIPMASVFSVEYIEDLDKRIEKLGELNFMEGEEFLVKAIATSGEESKSTSALLAKISLKYTLSTYCLSFKDIMFDLEYNKNTIDENLKKYKIIFEKYNCLIIEGISEGIFSSPFALKNFYGLLSHRKNFTFLLYHGEHKKIADKVQELGKNIRPFVNEQIIDKERKYKEGSYFFKDLYEGAIDKKSIVLEEQ